jgi:tRNA (mo5U34)-methyltransferase
MYNICSKRRFCSDAQYHELRLQLDHNALLLPPWKLQMTEYGALTGITKESITQAQIDALRWFHEYDFPGGLKARAPQRGHVLFHEALESFICKQLQLVDFENKTVLDIGCWDGFFSFYCEELGAKRVLAVDDFSQNWGTQECFSIAKELKSSSVNLMPDISVYDIDQALEGQKFDVILMLGLYYHLHAPYLALAKIRHLCHADTIVFIEGPCYRSETNDRALVRFDVPDKSKFVPNVKVLKDMLQSCYFEPVSTSFLDQSEYLNVVKQLPTEDVMALLSAAVKRQKSADINKVADTKEKTDRIFIQARPFSGKNKKHMYRPPFGLDQFDHPGRFERKSE